METVSRAAARMLSKEILSGLVLLSSTTALALGVTWFRNQWLPRWMHSAGYELVDYVNAYSSITFAFEWFTYVILAVWVVWVLIELVRVRRMPGYRRPARLVLALKERSMQPSALDTLATLPDDSLLRVQLGGLLETATNAPDRA